ncbi:MAG: dockerin type I domain-containing protein [Ruminococcus sp.]|nr:dockerin type I domain-containing protein [Ruminococcus sp.]
MRYLFLEWHFLETGGGTATSILTSAEEDSSSDEETASLEIGTTFVSSGDSYTEISLVTANNTPDTRGMTAAMYFPEETRAVLELALDEDSFVSVYSLSSSYGNDYNNAINANDYEESGLVRFATALSLTSLYGYSEELSGEIIGGYFDVADEETVIATAEEYGLELQYDDEEGYYYAFPITWADRDGGSTAYSCKSSTITTLMGDLSIDDAITVADCNILNSYVSGGCFLTDEGLVVADCCSSDGVDVSDALELMNFMVGSIDTFSKMDEYSSQEDLETVEVTVPYFTYLDASLDDIMDEIELIDGAINIKVSEPNAETTTTETTTTTTTTETTATITTTTETTTEESTTTTTESNDCAITLLDPYVGNLYVGNTFTMEYTVADDYTGGMAWLSNDASIVTVTQDGEVTITGEGTVTIRVMDDNGNTASVTFTTFTLSTTTTTTATTETTTITEMTTTTITTEETTTATDESTTTATASETTTTETTTTEIDPENVTFGDINLDGSITLSDVIFMNKVVAGTVTLNEAAVAGADVNSDGYVDTDDALILLKFVVQIVKTLPYTD